MRWPLQPLQPLQQTQLQPPFGQSVASLCHPWFTTTNVSYRFPIFETSATALCGTAGIIRNKSDEKWFTRLIKHVWFVDVDDSSCMVMKTRKGFIEFHRGFEVPVWISKVVFAVFASDWKWTVCALDQFKHKMVQDAVRQSVNRCWKAQGLCTVRPGSDRGVFGNRFCSKKWQARL